MVWQLFKVKLIEAFLGSCGSLFPQYFTNAILLGVCQVKQAFSIFFERIFGINCTVFKI